MNSSLCIPVGVLVLSIFSLVLYELDLKNITAVLLIWFFDVLPPCYICIFIDVDCGGTKDISYGTVSHYWSHGFGLHGSLVLLGYCSPGFTGQGRILALLDKDVPKNCWQKSSAPGVLSLQVVWVVCCAAHDQGIGGSASQGSRTT